MRNIIIHISGCQSSDTTTLSNKLKDRYNENIHLKDLDDLKNDFNQQKEISNYQEFINLFIEKHNDKPLILIGFTNNEIDTKYKYFIDNEKILKLCKKIHKKHNYKFLDIDKIMNKIFKIIENKKNYTLTTIQKTKKPLSLESEVSELKNEIKELKNTIKELVEMMKAVYEFEEALTGV